MFGFGWTEVLLTAAVALIAIGPRDLPRALHMLGRMARKMRGWGDELRQQFDQLNFEAEQAERAKKPPEQVP